MRSLCSDWLKYPTFTSFVWLVVFVFSSLPIINYFLLYFMGSYVHIYSSVHDKKSEGKKSTKTFGTCLFRVPFLEIPHCFSWTEVQPSPPHLSGTIIFQFDFYLLRFWSGKYLQAKSWRNVGLTFCVTPFLRITLLRGLKTVTT